MTLRAAIAGSWLFLLAAIAWSVFAPHPGHVCSQWTIEHAGTTTIQSCTAWR